MRSTALRPVALLLVLGVLGLGRPAPSAAQPGRTLESDTLTQSVLIHPPVATGEDQALNTREHTYRPQLRLGDQLARDFTVTQVTDDGVPRPYAPGTEGAANADWYGWRQDVMAPFDGTVVQTAAPDTTNPPGTMNREAQPGFILFQDESGVSVVYAHVREIRVSKGDTVAAGEVVAKVGNNGNSRAPHVHIGAWTGGPSRGGQKTGGTPLQIQVDLYAEERAGDE
jgi:murein DD-endopeptidase MepM/ murein hydrolase activator NlpD